ncbi:MAG: hypothetical protein OYH76_24665 [Defluviicoccus sp.]|nr:hypothetical protein [Defluviicoccus sp.]MDE0279101.1 hypothetical protein [Defluviicoccus sp.]
MLRLFSLLLIAAALSSTALATDTPRLRHLPLNHPSHSAEFFEDLLTNRVWVYERFGAPAAMYFGPNGELQNCSLRADRSGYRTSGPQWEWRIGDRHTKSNLQIALYPSSRKISMVIIYTPDTGRFHAEQYFRYSKSWQIVHDGWIQKTLPAVIRDRCRELDLPSTLQVEESQTQDRWSEFARPGMIVRNHPGSEYAYIGATGLGASRGKPTMTPKQAAAAELRMQGVIGLTPRGRRMVGVLTPHRKETWLVDEHDDLIDVGIVNPVPNRDIVVIRWQGRTPDYSLRTRYPIPIRPTPRRHPAFRMMKEITAASQAVALDLLAARTAPLLFSDDGKVRSGSLVGAWWISEGGIKIRIAGRTAAYAWRDFARSAGWTPAYEPSPPPFEEHYGGD